MSWFHLTHTLYTACLVPPQQFQIDIFIPGSVIVFCCLLTHLVTFSHHQSVTEVNCTTIDVLIRSVACFTSFFFPFFFSSSNFSSFLSSCLLKDNFASKPTDKHTMVHLNPHDLNLSHYYYIVQWKYICYLQCIRIAWVQLGSTQCFYGLRVRQIFLCVFKLKHWTCRG